MVIRDVNSAELLVVHMSEPGAAYFHLSMVSSHQPCFSVSDLEQGHH